MKPTRTTEEHKAIDRENLARLYGRASELSTPSQKLVPAESWGRE